FLLRELAVSARTRQLAECSFETFLDEAPLRPEDGRCSDRNVPRDHGVRRSGLRREENLRALQSPKRTVSSQHETVKPVALLRCQRDPKAYVHDGPPHDLR